MDNSKDNILQNLQELCVKFIIMLNEINEKGLLSDEEYVKEIKLKKLFLEYTEYYLSLDHNNIVKK